jgi:hypothetical protein
MELTDGGMSYLAHHEDSLARKYTARKNLEIQKSKASYEHLTARGQELMGKGQLLNARIGAVQTGISLFNILKPIIIGIVILFLVLGPGLASVMLLLGSMNIWIWVAVIFVLLLLWRNR